MLNKLMNKILGGTVNTTDNQVTAQVKAEPTVAKLLLLQLRLKASKNKRVAVQIHAALLAKVVRANKQLVKVKVQHANAVLQNTRTSANGGRTNTTRRTNTRRNAEQGEGQERKTRQTRAPRGENTRNTRTNNGRNGQNGQNRNNNRSNNRSTGWNNQEEQVELVGRTPNGANKGKFQIIPLGGLGEIGKNMTIFQYEDEIIVLDSGLAFPSEDMLGVDIVIPDMSYIIENKRPRESCRNYSWS